MTAEKRNLAARAATLAGVFHRGQRYGDSPYLRHLYEVVCQCKKLYGVDPELEMIAWLHDILEDTACTEVDLHRCGFPGEVVVAVVAITKCSGESREAYLERVKGNSLALKVKMADALCNLDMSLKGGDTRRVKKYRETVRSLV